MKLDNQNTELIEKLAQASQIRKQNDLCDITKNQIAELTQQLENATAKLANLRQVSKSYNNVPETTVNVSKPKREKANLVEVSGTYKPKTGIRLAQGSQNQICYELVNTRNKNDALQGMIQVLQQRSPGRDEAWYLARASKYVNMALKGTLGQV